MEEKLTRKQDLSNITARLNKEESKPKKKKGKWGGVRPGAGAPGVSKAGKGFGRKRAYGSGELKTCSFMITIPNLARLEAEAMRTGISRSAVINHLLETLPESVMDKTQAMQDAYLKKKALKNL